MRGTPLILAAMLVLMPAPAYAPSGGGGGGGGGGGDVNLSVGAKRSGQFKIVYERAAESIQNASLGEEQEKQLLSMLEEGRKMYAKSRIENNRRKAEQYVAEAISILDQVTKILGDEG
ncbi:MAG: hypothetical protein ACE5JZ_08795 [Kiloniellales bacterium]